MDHDIDIGNGAARLLCGDSLARLRELPDASVDAVVTDPPYGLSEHRPEDVTACLRAWLNGQEFRPRKRGFMGHQWDAWVPGPELWRECLRVLKPGGHLLAFAGTRSMDLMMLAVRLAGFELRDSIGWANDPGDPTQPALMAWVQGQGFPKSMDVSRAIDQHLGAERPDALRGGHRGMGAAGGDDGFNAGHAALKRIVPPQVGMGALTRGTPATAAARQWEGFGTSLKPAWEPIILARKPLAGTVAETVLQHGTGALNVDGCRIPPVTDADPMERVDSSLAACRFPANLITDGSAAVLALFPDSAGAGGSVPNVKTTGYGDGIGQGESHYFGGERTPFDSGSGSAARFFFCSKASRRDRNEGLPDGEVNRHPTVKPTALLRYICRLVTPPGGTLVDPFAGSGSTGKAALLEGFRFIGLELDPDHVDLAAHRCRHAWLTALEATEAAAVPAAEQVELFGT